MMAIVRTRNGRTVSTSMLLILSALMLMDTPVSGQDDFYDTKIKGMGSTARLYCDNVTIDKYQHPNGSVPMAWMLPDLTILYGSTANSKYMLEDNNYTLAISQVSQQDLGLYHCVLLTGDDEWFLVRLGLNARGPFYTTLWQEYRTNTIIGCSVAGGWLVLVALTYATSKLTCLSGFLNAFNNGGSDDDDVLGTKSGLYTVGRYNSTSEFNHDSITVEMTEKKGTYNMGYENGERNVHTTGFKMEASNEHL